MSRDVVHTGTSDVSYPIWDKSMGIHKKLAAATPFRPKKWHTFQTPLELGQPKSWQPICPSHPRCLVNYLKNFTLGVHPRTVALFHSSRRPHSTFTAHSHAPSRSQHLSKFRVHAASAARGAFARARLHTTRDYVTGNAITQA